MALGTKHWRLVRLALGALSRAGRGQRCPRFPPPSPALMPAPCARRYSSEREPRPSSKKVVVVGIPNPFTWARTKMYFFLIRAYFDQDFTFDEFAAGAKQAFVHVSNMLSQCNFVELKDLVSKEALEELEEKCSAMPANRRQAIAADLEEIMYSTPGDVGIYYDNQGRKFVSIIMRYWYLTDVDLPDETPEGTKVFQVVFGDESNKDSKRLLTANYEFRREFTPGVEPDWTITRIQHFKLLE
ncbi:m-AAA protease-interacting protein 1, mitochondrial isoform X1 [Amblyraja radiata]|uniref:m-AAA protease-interacting protein 1, mitochondrial isoform X1 n=1 Tax=Amblyraja radiata TaxID=386614 RepID=UPI00140309A0|nr:m-AAA protease-interacting protein 1, mitochondrial isoform X1 [Amblyraja radiata]XP_055487136.1 m-AAA protease-interacting protein 1, mitochondrial-like isoform X1 [Leucoraja erinacea]